MTIELPPLPRRTKYIWRPLPAGAVMRPAFGGGLQPVNRMGSRWSLEVDTGPLEPCFAQALEMDLLQGRYQRVALRLPMAGIDTGAPGAPTIKGGGQSGWTIVVEGATPHFAIRKGWPINVITDGQRYTYKVREETIVDASGEASVPIFPMLRAEPLDGDQVVIAEPWIEGIVETPPSMAYGLIKSITPERFVIEEIA